MWQDFERQESAGGRPPVISLLALTRTLTRGEAARLFYPSLQCALLTSAKWALHPRHPFVTVLEK